MNYKQCQFVFPSYDYFCLVARVGHRHRAVDEIPVDHKVVLASLSELCGEEWPLPLLQWMYLVNERRGALIKEYKKLIDEIQAGEIEIGTRKEAFENTEQ
jgi:hypothetical protein